jgi:hypothetical protein
VHFSNYREFYQKALIPIGEKDKTALLNTGSQLTHWLVSLEGQPRDNDEYYLWEVAIYPADNEGSFNWYTPLYRSTLFDCIDEAFEAARNLEQNGRNDELSSISL